MQRGISGGRVTHSFEFHQQRQRQKRVLQMLIIMMVAGQTTLAPPQQKQSDNGLRRISSVPQLQSGIQEDHEKRDGRGRRVLGGVQASALSF